MARRQVPRAVNPLAVYAAGRLAGIPQPYLTQGEVSPLELYAASLAPDFSGWWVYAFQDRGGEGKVWYAGQSGNLWSRWRDHSYHYGDRWWASDKWLIPVENEAMADLIELLLITWYDPECNSRGRRGDLERKVRRWQRGDQNMGKGDA